MTLKNAAIGSIAQTASRVLMLASGVILFSYLTRRLGITAYGEYATAIAVAQWFRFPVEAFLHAAIVPCLAGEDEPHRLASSILRTTLLCGIALGMMAALLGPLFATYTDFQTPQIWYPLALDICLGMLANAYLLMLMGQGRFLWSAIIFSSYWIARPLSAMFFIEWIPNANSTMGAAMAMPVASLVLFIACAIVDRCRVFRSPGMPWREMREKTRLYGTNGGLQQFLVTSDLIAMRVLHADPRAIGFYAAAHSLRQAFQILSLASNSVQLQVLSEARKRDNQHLFRSLTTAMLRKTLQLIGLCIIGLPFLPLVIGLILGRDYLNIHGICTLLLIAGSLRLLFATGRVLDAAMGERTKMQAFLFGLIFLSFAGFAWAIHVENVSANDSQNAALAQATRCASVPVITSAILATYALTVGLVRSEQRFPWRTALRIATASILLATIGYYVPVNGMWRLGVLASCVIIYVCVLLATGDLRTAFRELFERAPRHTADQQA